MRNCKYDARWPLPSLRCRESVPYAWPRISRLEPGSASRFNGDVSANDAGDRLRRVAVIFGGKTIVSHNALVGRLESCLVHHVTFRIESLEQPGVPMDPDMLWFLLPQSGNPNRGPVPG